MENIMATPRESLAESTWNVGAVNQILRNTDLGDELKISSAVFDGFNVTPDNQSVGDFLLNLPVPVSKDSVISFKWIIINKSTCNYIDEMRKPYVSEGFQLVDPTFKKSKQLDLGVNVEKLESAWDKIKNAKIVAGDIIKLPYNHEVIR